MALFCRVLSLLPLRRAVVATDTFGKVYGDNTQVLAEKIKQLSPETEVVWIKNANSRYHVADGIKVVSWSKGLKNLRAIYQYATARIWLDTHTFEPFLRKRKGQLVINTWHGGLGIKKIGTDIEEKAQENRLNDRLIHSVELTDLMISNSVHLTRVLRNAVHYYGPIWECGYPKNDYLLNTEPTETKATIQQHFHIPTDHKILLYAPTFREYKNKQNHSNIYGLDYKTVQESLQSRFGGSWSIIVRYHPLINKKDLPIFPDEAGIHDGTDYPYIQPLILIADAFMTDYSSGIFDAALRKIPCFLFALDYRQYLTEHGLYYCYDELPFPSAQSNIELQKIIKNYNEEIWLSKWNHFSQKVGLKETGHATDDISEIIVAFLNGNKVPLQRIVAEQDK